MQRNKRFPFTEKENIIIRECVKVFGEDWDAIAARLPGRTPKQIHDRYINYLRNGLTRGPWSKLEDDILIKMYHAIGPKWSKMMINLPGRSGNDIKNRWHKHLSKRIIKLKNDKHESNDDSNFDDNYFSIFDKDGDCNDNSFNLVNDCSSKNPSLITSQKTFDNNDQLKMLSEQSLMPSNHEEHSKMQNFNFEKKLSNGLTQNNPSNSKNQNNLENQMSIKVINKVNIKHENKSSNEKTDLNKIQDVTPAIFKPEFEIQEILEEINASNYDFPWI